jgi:hypothetical protein
MMTLRKGCSLFANRPIASGRELTAKNYLSNILREKIAHSIGGV